jgi:hypothetical protein
VVSPGGAEDGGSDTEEDDQPLAAAAGSSSKSRSGSKQPRIAKSVLAKCRVYGSVLSWVKMTEWKAARNKHECETLALVVDLLLAEGVKSSSTALEVLLRRLSGVHLADTTGEWKACEAVQWNATSNSLLPRDEVKRALKDAETMKRLCSGGSGSTPKRAFGRSVSGSGSGSGSGSSSSSGSGYGSAPKSKFRGSNKDAPSAERKSAAPDK